VAGLPEPEFAVSDGFQTIIRRTLAPSLAPQPESQPESLETRVIRLLEDEPKSKAELSRGLGQKEISGPPNKVVRKLLADRMIVSSLKTEQPAPEVPPHRARPGCTRERFRRRYVMSTFGERGMFTQMLVVISFRKTSPWLLAARSGKAF